MTPHHIPIKNLTLDNELPTINNHLLMISKNTFKYPNMKQI